MDGIMKKIWKVVLWVWIMLGAFGVAVWFGESAHAENYCNNTAASTINPFTTVCPSVTQVLSCSLTTVGHPTTVEISLRTGTNSSSQQQMRVLVVRDTAQIYTTQQNNSTTLNDLNPATANWTFHVNDAPSAATHVYHVNVCLPLGGNILVNPSYLTVREFPN